MGGQEENRDGLGGLDRRQLALAVGVCVLAAVLLLVALNLALRSDLRADYRRLHREIDAYRAKQDAFSAYLETLDEGAGTNGDNAGSSTA